MNRAVTKPPWSDDQLIAAVETSTNWRAVIRALGAKENSASVVRLARRHAERLGLDTSHFRGSRRWSDDQLRSALSDARTWDEAITRLGLSSHSGNIRGFLKSHAIRLGLECAHLSSQLPTQSLDVTHPYPEPELEHLRRSAASIAAAWFALSGCAVSIPVEPAVYDLLCELPDGIKRVQVKSTVFKTKDGWQAGVGHKPHKEGLRRPVPYEPGDIDLFFIVDGDLNMYLIPAAALAGAVRVSLRTYRHYIIGSARGFIALECQHL